MEEKAAAKPLKKQPNPDAGECRCPFCSTDQPVRKNVKGKLYLNCSNCGVIQPSLPFFQNWVLENASLYGADKPDRPTPRPAPVKQPEPDRADAPRVESAAPVADLSVKEKPQPASAGFRIFK